MPLAPLTRDRRADRPHGPVHGGDGYGGPRRCPGAWWSPRSSKPVRPSISVWRVRFPSASATRAPDAEARRRGAGRPAPARSPHRRAAGATRASSRPRPRLGAARVRAASRGAQERAAAAARSAPSDVGRRGARGPARARRTTLRPLLNATGVVAAHQPRPGAAVAGGRRGAAPRPPATSTSSTTSPPARGPGAAGARWRRSRRRVPGAEDALVVNNGAAALVLATTALAAGREVVVSRGEMVEIGDGFRLPDLIASTGARLREVGTTNRTRLRRLRRRGRPGHRLRAQGAPQQLPRRGLHRRGRRRASCATLGVPVVVDIGSGLLRPDPLLPDEPDAATALRRRRRPWSPAAATSCSAARRPGSSSATRRRVERLRRHPLARALRVDKLTLAALEATLRGPRPAGHRLPARRPRPAARRRTERLRRRPSAAEVVAVDGRGRRRRGARACRCPAGPSRCRRRTPSGCGAASPRSSRGSSAAAACSTCAACRRAGDADVERPSSRLAASRPDGG